MDVAIRDEGFLPLQQNKFKINFKKVHNLPKKILSFSYVHMYNVCFLLLSHYHIVNILYTITHQTLRNKIGGTISKRKVRSSFPEEETSTMSSLQDMETLITQNPIFLTNFQQKM